MRSRNDHHPAAVRTTRADQVDSGRNAATPGLNPSWAPGDGKSGYDSRVNHRLPALSLILAHLLLVGNIVIPKDMSRTPERSRPEKTDLVVAQVSDLHFGGTLRKVHRRAARVIRRVKPDVLLITGDSTGYQKGLRSLDTWLSSLETAAGHRYAVLGNWEYLLSPSTGIIEEVYRKNGVKLLINESVDLNIRGRALRITGLDDLLLGHPDYTLAGRPGPAGGQEILLVHEPAGADRLKGRARNLTILSGHTHGGQFTFFGKALYTPVGSGDYVEGEYTVGGNRLIVSRGIGASTIPFRWGPEPDIRILRIPNRDAQE